LPVGNKIGGWGLANLMQDVEKTFVKENLKGEN
jgi:hypothetical protein